ncbi:glucose-1-phosphate thymidylyltransferase [Pontibacter qinzhouensis]|uniref:Glucose-1-phosphate thymidylyltransferase n=1 Tax=Pontibacter qinzhouensis TaxID=2603253 RepID=A0A5C8IV92_9BACT|nr:GlmU family protein [Pontibacter qinzhouensis]TXK24752.1 glucose-1-phosphate thymidylyltransferase [Pontibacter qinzhouensis]
MNVVLFDEPGIRQSLLPLTFTRPVADIRIGILTIAEKWRTYLGGNVSYLTQPYLHAKFKRQTEPRQLFVNGAVCPDVELVRLIRQLDLGEALTYKGTLIALHTTGQHVQQAQDLQPLAKSVKEVENCTLLQEVWDIFLQNPDQIEKDFALVTAGRKSRAVYDVHTAVYCERNVFIEEGAKIRAAVLNAETGPIYIGKNTQVQEGALIAGPFALCEGSIVGMGGKMRGKTTVGPFSKVGGEVSNSVIFGHSNKGHDGYLGNSVLGEWCNLGADTNTSNLKNNYGEVKLWNYPSNSFKGTGQQFCGLIMGDHSKSSINTMFNTGTVVGVSANVYGPGFPPNFVPSFSWGGAAGLTTYRLDKALEVAERVVARRNLDLDATERAILEAVFEQTKQYRQDL